MKTFIFMLAALISLVGCSTKSPEHPVALSFHEKEIYASLKKEPVPLPRVTPYDADSRQRQFFMDGFRAGWDCAISGALLHGTFGTPPDLPDDVRKIWAAGWKSGAEKGSESWQKERRERHE